MLKVTSRRRSSKTQFLSDVGVTENSGHAMFPGPYFLLEGSAFLWWVIFFPQWYPQTGIWNGKIHTCHLLHWRVYTYLLRSTLPEVVKYSGDMRKYLKKHFRVRVMRGSFPTLGKSSFTAFKKKKKLSGWPSAEVACCAHWFMSNLQCSLSYMNKNNQVSSYFDMQINSHTAIMHLFWSSGKSQSIVLLS